MARAGGRDVILQLMDNTARLQQEMADVRELLDEHSRVLDEHSRQLRFHSLRLEELSRGFAQMADTTEVLASHAKTMSRRFTQMEHTVGQVRAGLVELDGRSKVRFESLEARVSALEHKG